jgi:hypothetical protein
MIIENNEISYLHHKTPKRAHPWNVFPLRFPCRVPGDGGSGQGYIIALNCLENCFSIAALPRFYAGDDLGEILW